jgi:Dynamin GTPase effector domain
MEGRRSYLVNRTEFDEQTQEAREGIEETLAREALANTIHENEKELQIMSEVCAYVDIATVRVIESIPMAVDFGFAKGCADRLRKDFLSKLGVTETEGVERCQNFARGDRAIQEEREKLKGYIRIAEDCLRASREVV